MVWGAFNNCVDQILTNFDAFQFLSGQKLTFYILPFDMWPPWTSHLPSSCPRSYWMPPWVNYFSWNQVWKLLAHSLGTYLSCHKIVIEKRVKSCCYIHICLFVSLFVLIKGIPVCLLVCFNLGFMPDTLRIWRSVLPPVRNKKKCISKNTFSIVCM